MFVALVGIIKGGVWSMKKVYWEDSQIKNLIREDNEHS